MIFIAGGTGFIGRHLVKALAEKGRAVRCLVRTPEGADQCKAMGFEASHGDITDRQSLKGALEGVHMVIHLVGIIEEKGGTASKGTTFKEVHVKGTENLIDEAKKAGVRHFFYQSALGASPDSWARYLKTKGQAEDIVKKSGLPFTIFRPSLVIGQDDGFTQKIKDIVSSVSPVIPVPGKGTAKFQPIYVGDWVRCFLRIIDAPGAIGKIYEFGGPEHLSYNEMVHAIADVMGSVKPIVHIPLSLVRFSAPLLRLATAEQIRLLETDNITDIQSVKDSFGFEPMSFKEALKLFIG